MGCGWGRHSPVKLIESCGRFPAHVAFEDCGVGAAQVHDDEPIEWEVTLLIPPED